MESFRYEEMKKNVISDYLDNLPYFPYMCNGFDAGVYKYPQTRAKYHAHCEFNPPAMIHWFVFDIDRPIDVTYWDTEFAPVPNMLVRNPDNGHAHLYYKLDSPVCRSQAGSVKALEYASYVEAGLCELLGGDRGYAGFIAKNPLHQDWDTFFIHDHRFSLNELHDNIPDAIYNKAKQHDDTYGLGRNCTLFHNLRLWSYNEYRKFNYVGDSRWFDSVTDKAFELNALHNQCSPLPYGEVCHIAKSVANFVAANFRPRKFSSMQSGRGALKGKTTRDMYKDKVVELYQSGTPIALICDRYPNLRYGTVWNWCNKNKG